MKIGVLAQLGEHLPYKQGVTGSSPVGPIFYRSGFADVAQLAEQLICNQQVIGSSPIIGFILYRYFLDGFPSGQRGQTVNLLSVTSVVRIHSLPPYCASQKDATRKTEDFLGFSRFISVFLAFSKNEFSYKQKDAKRPFHPLGWIRTTNHPF